ncbi:MAG TPA: NAD(P)/FAD-dependent oxidoreductase [Blastocatellia bacterium]|nr:NAD(P)/FAD-dependent oxidoreductase [Blastocatellia bacterium]
MGAEATDRVDVIVAGGGPAGAAMAIKLRAADLKVEVVEASSYDSFRVGETVPPAILPSLQKLGAWESFARDAHLPSRGNCSVWGNPYVVFHDAVFSQHGGGWHLDRARFDRTLAVEAERRGARWLTSTRLTGIERKQDGRWLVNTNGAGGRRQVLASFVVDATGRRATVASRCGARRVRRVHSDRLVGAFAVLQLRERSGAGFHTLVEAAEHGWWYAARLPGNRAVVSWMSDSDLVRQFRAHQPERWRKLLAESLHVRESVPIDEPPATIGLRSAASHCLDHVGGEGWLAIGDAASCYDPLSSAGIVSALRSGIEGADTVTRCLGGDRSALADYDEQVHQRFTDYLGEWRAYYALETRWRNSEFWRRRH